MIKSVIKTYDEAVVWWNKEFRYCLCGGRLKRACSYTFPILFEIQCDNCGKKTERDTDMIFIVNSWLEKVKND